MWILENNHYHHHHHIHSHHSPFLSSSIIGISTPFLNSIVDTVYIFFLSTAWRKRKKMWGRHKERLEERKNERNKEKMYYWKIFLEEINFYLNERTLNMFVMHSKSFMKCKYAVYYMMGIYLCNSQHWHCYMLSVWLILWAALHIHVAVVLCVWVCLLYFCENCDNE